MAERGVEPEMAPLLERIARIETSMSYEREQARAAWAHLNYRLQLIERRPPPVPPVTLGWVAYAKVLIAILLPLLVLLSTGSPDKAMHAARAVGSMP